MIGVVTEKLLSTGAAAREIGVSGRTLSAWAHDGTVTPALWTAGGHARWDLDELRGQLAALRRRDE